MRTSPHSRSRREGMTLLEVLLALAILLFSIVAISQLFNSASDQALEIQMKSRATALAQSKMAEFVSGVISLSSGGGGDFSPEEPDWSWSANVGQQGTAQNLWTLTVTVNYSKNGGNSYETSLTQFIMDPKQKGTISTLNAVSTQNSNSNSGSSSSGQQSNNSNNSSNGSNQSPMQGGQSGGMQQGGGTGATAAASKGAGAGSVATGSAASGASGGRGGAGTGSTGTGSAGGRGGGGAGAGAGGGGAGGAGAAGGTGK